MSAQIIIPNDGSGLVHNFVLSCTTCRDTQLAKSAYTEEVSDLGNSAMLAWLSVLLHRDVYGHINACCVFRSRGVH